MSITKKISESWAGPVLVTYALLQAAQPILETDTEENLPSHSKPRIEQRERGESLSQPPVIQDDDKLPESPDLSDLIV